MIVNAPHPIHRSPILEDSFEIVVGIYTSASNEAGCRTVDLWSSLAAHANYTYATSSATSVSEPFIEQLTNYTFHGKKGKRGEDGQMYDNIALAEQSTVYISAPSSRLPRLQTLR